VLDDRILLSEAIEAVGRMIRGYPNSKDAPKSYIGALSELLMKYPRVVAMACADPFQGVARETRFLPTPADVIGFCEKRVAPLYADADREARETRQLNDRDDWQNAVVSPRLKAMGQAWLDRSDLQARQLISGQEIEKADQHAAGLERVQEANKAVFERECAAAGIDPARGVSPALLETLEVES
jgi:hypothetical protein